ncbi:GNAT family N-acetyltransferase [Clostridiaceae bacterium M8S5]|nr:GNAT family N-acetyltransferase [Clostridiaceae bacterium M8S5]
MKMNFRPFKNKNEEANAKEIIAAIDKGEKDIFEDSKIVDKQCLYYSHKDTTGIYCMYSYDDKIHIQIGFNTDMPDELESELLNLIKSTKLRTNYNISIWYSPRNKKLEGFLFDKIKWKKKGPEVYEFTAIHKNINNVYYKQMSNVTIIPFEERYIIDTCTMLDKALAHTFDDPTEAVFLNNRDNYINEWMKKAKEGECCMMIENNIVVGAYILSGAEIELIAVAVDKQGKGFGKQLLRHAIIHILQSQKELPYLYCLSSNSNSLNFYQHEGLVITAYSGYLIL